MTYVIRYWNSQLEKWIDVKNKHQKTAIFKTKDEAIDVLVTLKESMYVQTRIVPIKSR